MARPQENIILADADRQALEAVLRSHKTPQSRALRARIVLKSGAGEIVETIATSLGTSTKSVYKWRTDPITFETDEEMRVRAACGRVLPSLARADVELRGMATYGKMGDP